MRPTRRTDEGCERGREGGGWLGAFVAPVRPSVRPSPVALPPLFADGMLRSNNLAA